MRTYKHLHFQSTKWQEKYTRFENSKMPEKVGKVTDGYVTVSIKQ